MELGGSARSPEPPPELATALAQVARDQGDRPAVTVYRPAAEPGAPLREEQGFASLAQWAAKGAHLLQLDLLLEPGQHVAVAIPAGWPLSAVCAAVWWAGGVVDLDGGGRIAVVHPPHRAPDPAEDVLVVGDAVDGAPLVASAAEPWALAVQAFPDQPPPSAAAADAPALAASGRTLTQAEVVASARDLGTGRYGVHAGEQPAGLADVLAIAARPLATGRATVIVRSLDREVAAQEAVRTWG